MKTILPVLLSLLVLAATSAPAQEIDKASIKVTASSFEQKAKGGVGDMPPERSLDGDLKTAWMAEGDGEWIQYDFGSIKSLKAVKLAFAKGSERVYTFDILISATGDDNSWKSVADKLKNSGKSNDLETFSFEPSQARYVKIVGHGNTSEKYPKWCNITEAVFQGE